MAILTKQQFTAYAQSKARNESFARLLIEAKQDRRANKTVSIFLSHSHKDKDMIEAGIAYFKGLDVSIFIDWADKTMPEETSGETAIKIKQKIKENKKFILLATNHAVGSKWCNWELGIGDLEKFNSDNLVVIPLADNSGSWDGNEYIQIYPRIEDADKRENKGQYKVVYPDGHVVWLSSWLMK